MLRTNMSKSNGSSNGKQKQQEDEEKSTISESPGISTGVGKKVAKSRKSRRKTFETKADNKNKDKDTPVVRMPSLKETESSVLSKDSQDNYCKAKVLSSYKIPKKKADESKNSVISAVAVLPKAQTVRTNEFVSTLKKDERKRKSEDLDTVSLNKRCPSHSTEEKVVNNDTLPKRKTQVYENSTSVACSQNSRPKLSAIRRVLASDKPGNNGLAKNAMVDTPQMAILKAKIATRNANKGREKLTRCNEVDKELRLEVNLPTAAHQSPTANQDSIATFETNISFPKDAYAEVPDILELVRNGSCNREMDMADAMDVDIIQLASPSTFKQLLIVLDTNVWISNQDLIKEILEMDFPSSPPATLILPWMVLQEIDHKKNSRSATGFRNASKFIYDLLSRRHPRVKAQKATEAYIGMEFNELMADDSILNCAIQYNKLPQIDAVLVTNDVNLLNKALVHGLTAHKPDQGLVLNLRKLQSEADSQTLNDLESSTDAINHSFLSSNVFCTPSISHSTLNPGVQVLDYIEDVDIMDVDDPMDVEESNNAGSNRNEDQQHAPDPPTFEAVATALQQTLTSIIVPKMVEEYGKDGWRFAIKVKPPYTVESGIKCLKAHWIAVFSYLFPSRGKELIDELVKLFQQKHGHASAVEIKAWRLNVCQMANVLLSLNNEISSRARVSECCCLLQEYIKCETNQQQ